MHWSAVWERLANDFQVIAPDLPGIGWPEQPPLTSIKRYAGWLEHLLDRLSVASAWCVGNSFGCSVAWRFAAQSPQRCRGLVMVNGFPVPHTPALLHWLGQWPISRSLLRNNLRKKAYTSSALERGFADPRNAPVELRHVLRQRTPPQLEAMVQALIEGDGGPPPKVSPLLLWGASDQLPGSDAHAATKLHAALEGSTLTFIPLAGHLPQSERPELFVEALESFIGAHAPPVALA
jgi:2-hydroxy-6-oxonona-2,4-dienedioate hydrolase